MNRYWSPSGNPANLTTPMYLNALRIATGQGGATCPSSPFWQMPTFYPRRGRIWRPRAQNVQAGRQCLALGPSHRCEASNNAFL